MSSSITTIEALASTPVPRTETASRLAYFDTTIWNRICDQGPEARVFAVRLANLNCHLVLGLNVYFELLRTFAGSRPNSDRRVRELFDCLSEFLRIGVQIVRTWDEILVDEARCSIGLTTRIPLLYNEEIQRSFRYWSDLHSKGEIA